MKGRERDVNQMAAEAIRKATQSAGSIPAGFEPAWTAWIAQIQKVDERTMTLLRAAFEAGFEAGKR